MPRGEYGDKNLFAWAKDFLCWRTPTYQIPGYTPVSRELNLILLEKISK
jgi:hypothetical protein